MWSVKTFKKKILSMRPFYSGWSLNFLCWWLQTWSDHEEPRGFASSISVKSSTRKPWHHLKPESSTWFPKCKDPRLFTQFVVLDAEVQHPYQHVRTLNPNLFSFNAGALSLRREQRKWRTYINETDTLVLGCHSWREAAFRSSFSLVLMFLYKS